MSSAWTSSGRTVAEGGWDEGGGLGLLGSLELPVLKSGKEEITLGKDDIIL